VPYAVVQHWCLRLIMLFACPCPLIGGTSRCLQQESKAWLRLRRD